MSKVNFQYFPTADDGSRKLFGGNMARNGGYSNGQQFTNNQAAARENTSSISYQTQTNRNQARVGALPDFYESPSGSGHVPASTWNQHSNWRGEKSKDRKIRRLLKKIRSSLKKIRKSLSH